MLTNDIKPAILRSNKLISHFNKRERYVVEYDTFKYYISKGLVVGDVHRILRYKVKDWMASYIAKNAELRAKSKTKAEKDFFKLMNNNVYGKTVENAKKRVDIALVTNDDVFQKRVNNYKFKEYKAFHQNLLAVHNRKCSMLLNKPIYVGATVLDISKRLLFEYFYDDVKIRYPNTQIIYTDTDSIVEYIHTEDLYDDIRKIKNKFDTSDYECKKCEVACYKNQIFSKKNAKVVGSQ